MTEYPITPDGRYFVINGHLWRCSNPSLPEGERKRLVSELMAARRRVRAAKGDKMNLSTARADLHQAKVALGKRGPVWWSDESHDYNHTPC